jgi:hypothetical protein
VCDTDEPDLVEMRPAPSNFFSPPVPFSTVLSFHMFPLALRPCTAAIFDFSNGLQTSIVPRHHRPSHRHRRRLPLLLLPAAVNGVLCAEHADQPVQRHCFTPEVPTASRALLGSPHTFRRIPSTTQVLFDNTGLIPRLRDMHGADDSLRLQWPDVVVLLYSLIGGRVIRHLLWVCAGNAASIITASERPRICDARNCHRSKLSYIETDLKCTVALPLYAIAVMLLSLPALAHIVWVVSHPCESLRMAAVLSHAAFTSAPPSKWLQFAGDCKILATHGIRPPATTKCPRPS